MLYNILRRGKNIMSIIQEYYWALLMLSLPIYVFVTMIITSELKKR